MNPIILQTNVNPLHIRIINVKKGVTKIHASIC